jgi:hypothetical protein
MRLAGVVVGMTNTAVIVSGKITGAGVEEEVGASIVSGMIDCAKVFSAREGRLASTQ